ncbi:MAG: DNA helicase RecQ [Candidatus Omnitrophota bacterium]|nr:DNA helicase RecQ [Candidatus Omnitrophota bacterium]
MDNQQRILDTLKKYWGYTSLRPFQAEVMRSVLDGRESLTVMPTGGGKSLCFQLPALLTDGMAVVISPLISLMKDQVDDLRDKGIEASCLNSGMPAGVQRDVIQEVLGGGVKLLYIAPERLQKKGMIELLKPVKLSFFVIDEAHCISHWGHDFRSDYRNLWMIKEVFDQAKIHAFTATATKEVQRDIVEQLRLNAPDEHIGHIDRENLTYRVSPRTNMMTQVTDILKKHENEPGIIYCLRRKDVDSVSEKLNRMGYKNLPYHAGLPDSVRHENQDMFAREEVDIIVATVAFGMGIDRSNIRFIIHAAMPKSIEHYHQETGRAGRDGLPSSCYMLYGGTDYRTWSYFIEQSSERDVPRDKLNSIYNFCSRPRCRHKVLVNYFGQDHGSDNCGACDYCLKELDMVEEAELIGQTVLSCIDDVRAGRTYGFGAGHVANVLKGSLTDKIERLGQQSLATFGKMDSSSVTFIRYMIEQMVGQGFLKREEEFSTLSVTDTGRLVLAGKMTPTLAKPLIAAKKSKIEKKRKARREKDWEGADEGLFQLLRKKRTELAREEGVAAYIIFGDKSLKDMAASKPVTVKDFAETYGVGERKLKAYAGVFIEVIKGYLEYEHGK